MAVINLKEYLRNVYGELKNHVEDLSEEDRLDFVKKCHDMFEDGTADYSDRYMVAFYILKYARAYGFQFSRAYLDILSDMEHPDRIRSTSFGCGTGIDYWGMSYAARQICDDAECELEYTGIDPQIWPYRISEAEDMPEQDKVRYNTVNIHTKDGYEAHDNTEECDNFGKYLSIMETNADEPLDDIYFFPHSIKEVSVNTVQEQQIYKTVYKYRVYDENTNTSHWEYTTDLDEGPEDKEISHCRYTYNAYQSMARFSRLIRDRIGDRTIYVAFTYRSTPNESRADIQQKEAYDMRYGTFFRTCLIQRGLNVEIMPPFDIHERRGRSLCTYESDERFRESYFDYDECHSYTGAPEGEGKIWYLHYDSKGSFDSIYNDTRRRNYDSPKICDRSEWSRFFCDEDGKNDYPMDNVENMCYQVFKISVDQVADDQDSDLQVKNEWLDILEESMRDFKFNIDFSSSFLDIFVKQIKGRLSNEALVGEIFERVTSRSLNNIQELTNMLDYNTIVQRIITEGYVEVANPDDGGVVKYKTTDKGKRAGIYVGKNHKDKILVIPYAQQNIVANIICGRYIDWGNRT